MSQSSTQNSTPSFKKQIIFALSAVVAIALILGLIKYFQITKAIAANQFSPPPEAVTSTITTAISWSKVLSAVGSVQSTQGAILSVEEPGTVSNILFESGQKVEKGQLLVALDTTVEEAQLQGAEAVMAEAAIVLARSQRLRAVQANAQAELDQALARWKQTSAEVESIRATIARKRIISPVSGRAGIRRVNVGQYVAAGTEIVPVHSLNPIYVNFDLPQQVLAVLKIAQPVNLSVDSFPGEIFRGEISALDPSISTSTRTVMVQATFRNQDERLRPGMFVKVAVELPDPQQLVAIPSSSISYAPYGDTVYVIEDIRGLDGKTVRGVRQQLVKLGDQRGEQIAVLEGLKPGEEIVTSGAFKLRPGATVIVDNSFAPGNNPAPKPDDT